MPTPISGAVYLDYLGDLGLKAGRSRPASEDLPLPEKPPPGAPVPPLRSDEAPPSKEGLRASATHAPDLAGLAKERSVLGPLESPRLESLESGRPRLAGAGGLVLLGCGSKPGITSAFNVC